MDDVSCTTGEQMPQEQFQRVPKKLEIPQQHLTQEAMRSKIAHTTLEKTFEKARYSQSGCCLDCQRNSPELGASNVSGMRFKISSLSPRPRRQWRCRRKPNAANVRSSCRREGDQQRQNQFGATKMNNIYQFKIQAHRAQSKQKRTRDQHTKDREKPKYRETSANPKQKWWMSWTHSSTRFQSVRKRCPRTLRSC